MNNVGVINFIGMMIILLCLMLKYFFFMVKLLFSCMYNRNN